MALILADRVRETTTTAGTGTITLLGAVSSCQSFAVVGDGNTTYYTIVAQSGTEWEVGIGTYTSSGTTLSRDTVLSSSNSGSLVNFSAGTKDVFVDYPASKAVYENAAGNVDGYPITGGTIDNTTIGATTPNTGVFTTLGVTTSINASSGSANADLNVNSKGTGNVNIGTGNGTQFRVGDTFAGGTATNFYKAQGTAGGGVVLVADGASTNVQAYLASKGASPISFTTAGVGVEQMRVSHTASAVNYVQVTGAATGSGPIISAQGSDTDVRLNFTSKGTNSIDMLTNSAGTRQFRFAHTASAINYLQATGAATGSAPILSSQGSDTNIDLNLTTKGTGSINLNSGTGVQMKVSESVSAADAPLRVFGGKTAVAPPTISGDLGLRIQTSNDSAIRFATDGGTAGTFGTEQMRIARTASAVNYVQATGAATGSGVAVSAQGSDSNIRFNLSSKGSGGLGLYTNNFATTGLNVANTASGVNYYQVASSATGNGLQFSAQGTDTNISQVFQSKGTGAIDLAAGSSGVNISNGGTVTAITRTATGSGYTSFPSVAISAPTTAGGVQAVVTIAQMQIAGATIQAGGTGYTVGDTLTIVGGTPVTSAATLTVATVSGGVITGVNIGAFTNYTALPTNPVSVTGGTGSGATFNINYAVISFTITNAGSGYVEQPTVTFSGGGGSGAAAFARVGGAVTLTSLGSTLNLNTEAGTGFRVLTAGTTATDMWQAISNGTTAILRSSNATSNAQVQTSGTGGVQLGTNSGVTQCLVAHTASAVNYVQVTGAATGGNPYFLSAGSDSNIGLVLASKGTGAFGFWTNGGANQQFLVTHTASAVNRIQVTGAATGSDPVLSAQGSDTNIDLVLSPKGTGALQAQLTDSTATGGNARGANAVDWQTIRSTSVRVASGQSSVVSGGASNAAQGYVSVASGGDANISSAAYGFIGGGSNNIASGLYGAIVGGSINTTAGYFNFVGGGFTNSGTSGSAVTTQSATMNGTTAVTLAASNASIKVGQYITGTSIASDTYVAAVSGTSLTLSKNASGSSTSTLSFFTPHGVVVGGGNNQATGSYSFIGGGGDAGTAANRNVASGDWSFVGGGQKNTASGRSSVVVGGFSNTASTDGAAVVGGGFYAGNAFPNNASGTCSFIGGGFSNQASGFGTVVVGGNSNIGNGTYSMAGGLQGTNRLLHGGVNFSSGALTVIGDNQYGIYLAKRQTTDATATVLTFDNSAAGTTNQVILPNNSAYYFKVEIIANVTGGGNTSGWELKGVIKRGANAASTAIVGSVTSTLIAQDAGASTWAVSATADTTNGGLKITCTGQASTTIRWVAKASTTEVTF